MSNNNNTAYHPFETSMPYIVDASTFSSNKNDGIGEKQKRSAVETSIIIEDDYGRIQDENGQNVKVTKYILLNEQKVFIEIINYGATVVSCWVPNKYGELEDVVLGFDSIEDYRSQNMHSIGSTLGRVTDFKSNNYLRNNNEPIINHGSQHIKNEEKGFDKVMWDGFVEDDKLVLTYSSKDGEEGHPGTFQARITFCLTCKNELVVDYVGMTSKSTPVNITSNMFFNLAGHNTGESEIVNHSIMVNANEYVAVKLLDQSPIDLLENVHRTCLDLRLPRLLKKAFPLIPGFGYNHTFKLFKGNEQKAFNLAASLMHGPSGRMLDIYTDMPCILINTAQNFPNYGDMLFKEEVLKITHLATPNAKFSPSGNELESNSNTMEDFISRSNLDLFLPEDEQNGEYEMESPPMSQNNLCAPENIPIVGKLKTVYKKHSGICIRPQLFPYTVTHKNVNSTVLKPTNFYSQRVIYKFGVINSI